MLISGSFDMLKSFYIGFYIWSVYHHFGKNRCKYVVEVMRWCTLIRTKILHFHWKSLVLTTLNLQQHCLCSTRTICHFSRHKSFPYFIFVAAAQNNWIDLTFWHLLRWRDLLGFGFRKWHAITFEIWLPLGRFSSSGSHLRMQPNFSRCHLWSMGLQGGKLESYISPVIDM